MDQPVINCYMSLLVSHIDSLRSYDQVICFLYAIIQALTIADNNGIESIVLFSWIQVYSQRV